MSGKQNDNNDDDFENLISRMPDLQFRYKSIKRTPTNTLYTYMYNGAEIGYCPQMIFWIMFIGNATALRFNSIKSHWCIVQHASLLLSANNGNKSSTTQIVLLCWPLSAQLRAFQRILQLVSTLLGFCSFSFFFWLQPPSVSSNI